MKTVTIYGRETYGVAKTVPIALFNGWKRDGKLTIIAADYVYRTDDKTVLRFSRVFGFVVKR